MAGAKLWLAPGWVVTASTEGSSKRIGRMRAVFESNTDEGRETFTGTVGG